MPRAPLWAPCGFSGGEALLVDRDLDDFLLDGVRDQLRFVMDIEFAHQVEFVGFHGLDAQPQSHRDLLHGIAFRQKLQDFAFTGREPVSRTRERKSSTSLPSTCELRYLPPLYTSRTALTSCGAGVSFST